ncbi:MAG: hypothetical protein AAFU82_06670 [Pseudomonadota bacterium]
MRKLLTILTMAALLAGPVTAQEWGDLDTLLRRSLSPTGSMEGSIWLPDGATPQQSARALGVAYVHVVGSAGSVSLHSAVFTKSGNRWVMALPVRGLFGIEPRNPIWFGDRMEVTTTVLQPGEPRCCPTGTGVWSIDLRTGQAARLR